MMARKGAMNVLSFGEILWDVIEGEYWIGGAPPTGVPDQGTDVGALSAGYASLTPLKLDLTAVDQLARIQDIFGG